MQRIRTIKPEFFKHGDLFDAEQETGLPLRLAFAGLWTLCDREGRFKWRPREMKLDVLPYDDVDFSRVLDALATRGFIVKYASGAEFFGYVPSWKENQFINNKEPESRLPNPSDYQHLDACATRESPADDASATRGVKEGNINNKGEGASVTRGHRTFALPEWITKSTWDAFEEHRRKLRKPMTDRARCGIVREIDLLRAKGHNPEKLLDYSITRGWASVFEPRGDTSQSHVPAPKPKTRVELSNERQQEERERALRELSA